MGRPQFTRRNEGLADERARQGDTRSLDSGATLTNNSDPSTVGGTSFTLENKDGSHGDEVVEHVETAAQGFEKYNGLLVFECQDEIGGETLWLFGVNPGECLALQPALPYPEGSVIRVRGESYTGGEEYGTVSMTVS